MSYCGVHGDNLQMKLSGTSCFSLLRKGFFNSKESDHVGIRMNEQKCTKKRKKWSRNFEWLKHYAIYGTSYEKSVNIYTRVQIMSLDQFDVPTLCHIHYLSVD